MMVNVGQLDQLTSFLASMPGMNERATKSSFSSIGFRLKTEAKDALKNNSFGWPQLSKLTQLTSKYPAIAEGRTSSALISREAVTGRVSKKLWGSLANLLVYSFEKSSGILLFGFAAGTYGKKTRVSRGVKIKVDNVIGQSAVDLAEKLTNGFTYVVGTGPKGDAQRRYFAALGIILPKGKTMNIPARPLVGPVFSRCRPSIPQWFRDKFWERLRAYNEPGKIINSTWKAAA